MECKVSAKTLKQYYKRFARGEQYISLDRAGKIINEDKNYFWQQRGVYNHILPIIMSQGKSLSENDLYGRNGLVALLEPYQRAYNNIMNLHNEHLESATHGWMAAEDGSIDVDSLENDGLAPGKVIVYRQGSVSPAVIKDTPNTQPYLESAAYYHNQILCAAKTFLQAKRNDNKAEKVNE